MKIKEIYIESFGKLNNLKINFADALNVIEGENESGKSTLMAFISYMLFGADNSNTSYIKASGDSAGGKMLVYCRRYGDLLIERETSVHNKKVAENTRILSMPFMKEIRTSKLPGEYILGVDRDFFKNTAFIAQSGASSYDSKETSFAVQNILLSGSEELNPEKGSKRLNELRKQFKLNKGRGGIIAGIEDEISTAQSDIYTCGEIQEKLKKEESDLSEYKKEIYNLSALTEAVETEKKARENAKHRVLEQELAQKEEGKIRQKKAVDAQKKICEDHSEKQYKARLRALEIEINVAKSNVSATEVSKDQLLRETKAFKAKESLADEECAKFIDLVSISRSKAETTKSMAIFSFVVALLMLVLAIVLGVAVQIAFAIVFACLTVVVSFLGFLMLSKTKAILDGAAKALSKYGFEEDSSIAYIKESFARRNSEKAVNDAKIESIRQKDVQISDSNKKIQDSLSEISEIGKTLSVSLNHNEYTETIKKCEEAIDSQARKLSQLEGELSVLEEKIVEIKAMLAKMPVYDESLSLNPAFSEYPDSLLEEKLVEIRKRKDYISEKIEDLTVKISTERANLKDPDELKEKIKALRLKLDERKKQLDIIQLAEEAIKISSDNIRMAVTPNLIEEGNEILSKFTKGKYNRVGVDDSLSMNGIAGELTESTSLLSYGTNEAVYISLRIALCRVLCRDELPPLMLDESLAHIDNNRSAEILSMLSESGTQTLVFTCSDRESRVAKEKGIVFSAIKL